MWLMFVHTTPGAFLSHIYRYTSFPRYTQTTTLLMFFNILLWCNTVCVCIFNYSLSQETMIYTYPEKQHTVQWSLQQNYQFIRASLNTLWLLLESLIQEVTRNSKKMVRVLMPGSKSGNLQHSLLLRYWELKYLLISGYRIYFNSQRKKEIFETNVELDRHVCW